MHSQLLSKIENNFDRQSFLKSEIRDLRQAYTSKNIFIPMIYGSRSEISDKIKSKIKLLRRLKQSNARSIEALLKENNSKQYDNKNK